MLGLISLYMFYEFYWKWNLNSEGRAFDPAEFAVYHDSSFVWGLAALMFFLPLLLMVMHLIFQRKKVAVK